MIGGHLLCVDDQFGDEESYVQGRCRIWQFNVKEFHPRRKFTWWVSLRREHKELGTASE